MEGTINDLKTDVKLLLLQGEIDEAVNRVFKELKPYHYKDLPLPSSFNLDDLKYLMKKNPDEELIKGWIHNLNCDINRLNEKKEILKMFICYNDKKLEKIINLLISVSTEINNKYHEKHEFESFLKK